MKKLILLFFILNIFVFAQSSCEDRLFSIKSEAGIRLKEYLDNLADECALNIVVTDKIAKKRLNRRIGKINLNRATFDELLNLILDREELYYKLQNNILKIGYLRTKTFHIDYVISKRTGEATTDASVDLGTGNNQGGLTTSQSKNVKKDVNIITSKEEFDFWTNLQKEIAGILNRPEDSYKAPDPIINQKAGLVTITGTDQQIQRVEKYIQMIEERLHKEVLIDVSILAVLLDDSFTTGIDWSKFNIALNGDVDQNGHFIPSDKPYANYLDIATGSNFKNLIHTSTATTIINASFNLSGLLNFLQKNGKVVTLSNPKILTLNNQPAIITIGDTYFYRIRKDTTPNNPNGAATQTTYEPASIFVGILLNITPEITQDNSIILRINPSISELRDPTQLGGNGNVEREIAPDTKEKKISTIVKIKDGATLILGGLISNTKNYTINGVPILKNIPILGNLFRSQAKKNQRFELIFVIRPKIIKDITLENIGISDLGFKHLKIDE